jgi:hypothetical protein
MLNVFDVLSAWADRIMQDRLRANHRVEYYA